MSEVYYFSDWSAGMSCDGPPTSMYIIDALDLGPSSFQWAQSELVPESCGYAELPLLSGCCMGSYDLESSVAESMMTSSVPVEASPEAFIEWTTVTAIGYNYCSATYMTASGYSLTKYLIDDGICRESWQCDGGVLKISNSTDECMGDYQEILADTEYSSILENTVAIGYSVIEEGGQKLVWNGFYPFTLNVIYLNSFVNILGFIFISIIMGYSIPAIVYILYQMRLNPQQRSIYLPILFCEFFSIGASASTIVFYFFPQEDEYQFLVLRLTVDLTLVK